MRSAAREPAEPRQAIRGKFALSDPLVKTRLAAAYTSFRIPPRWVGAYKKRRTRLSEQIPEGQRTISRDELFYTVQAASQILSWATDHHGMIFAHETPGFDPRNTTEPAWLAHLHHAQEDLSMALAEILPKDDPGSHGRGYIRA
jgi:hypothetical protein